MIDKECDAPQVPGTGYKPVPTAGNPRFPGAKREEIKTAYLR